MALKLDSNPSTGYGWQFACSSPAVSKVGSSFTIPRGDEERMGAPALKFWCWQLPSPVPTISAWITSALGKK